MAMAGILCPSGSRICSLFGQDQEAHRAFSALLISLQLFQAGRLPGPDPFLSPGPDPQQAPGCSGSAAGFLKICQGFPGCFLLLFPGQFPRPAVITTKKQAAFSGLPFWLSIPPIFIFMISEYTALPLFDSCHRIPPLVLLLIAD